jgi:hypothetical protein
MAPQSTGLVTLDGGARTLALAPRVGQHVAPVLAPGCAPRLLIDGFQAYTTALRTPSGPWGPPARHQATGPAPKPRWRPLPQFLEAQVIKTTWRRRLVSGKHRVVFGTLAAVEQGLAACGGQLNPAFIERLTLAMRHQVAAVGRQVSTLGQGEDGLHQQLSWDQSYDNFGWPPSSFRQPFPRPEPPTAAARPRGGSPGRRPWRRGCPTLSGPSVRCACAASRRGSSPRGYAHAVVVGHDTRRGPERARGVHTARGEGVTRGARAAGRP